MRVNEQQKFDMAWKPDWATRIAKVIPDGDFHLAGNAGRFLRECAGEEMGQRHRFS